jgi:hypothetical protein
MGTSREMRIKWFEKLFDFAEGWQKGMPPDFRCVKVGVKLKKEFQEKEMTWNTNEQASRCCLECIVKYMGLLKDIQS